MQHVHAFLHMLMQIKLYLVLSCDYGTGLIDISTWKKVDSRTLGISWSKISVSSQIVMKALRREGCRCYIYIYIVSVCQSFMFSHGNE